MNDIVKHEAHDIAPPVERAELIRVLQSSLYPGAKPESIELVLAYCRANRLDVMLKPVHIVPTSVKKPDGSWQTTDVLMPGIADYRIKAARSGEYGGKSEPEFGPDITQTLGGVTVTFPEWCRVTVRRIVQGHARDFTAKERWLENYATAKRDSDAPNRMWLKRAYGQLAKCCEAQVLRMAFPEFSAGYTAEEMEGRDTFDGPTLDVAREQTPRLAVAAAATPRAPRVVAATAYDTAWLAPLDEPNPHIWLGNLERVLAACTSQDEVTEAGGHVSVRNAVAKAPPDVRRRVSELLAQHFARLAPDPAQPPDEPAGEVTIAGEKYAAA